MPRVNASNLWRRAAMTVEARRTSRIVAATAMLVYVFFAGAHWLVLEGQSRLVMTIIAAGSAAVAAILLIAVRAMDLRGEWVVNSVLAIVAVNTLFHFWVTNDPRQTSNVVLVIVALGFFLLQRWVATSAIAAVVAAWAFLMPRDAGELVHYSFSIGAAVVLATIVGVMRRRLLFAATQAARAWSQSDDEMRRREGMSEPKTIPETSRL